MLEGRFITLGVTGGIAAYKAADLASKLTGQGASVHVIMTRSAGEFVRPLTFEALTGNPVSSGLFVSSPGLKMPHIDLAGQADLVAVAPATANLLGKLAHGIADDLLTTTLLASTCPVLLCPAMNVHMYANKAVQENIVKLTEYGYHFVEPEVGRVACGHFGRGRLAETATIIRAITVLLQSPGDMQGLTVVVTAGGTREPIDPCAIYPITAREKWATPWPRPPPPGEPVSFLFQPPPHYKSLPVWNWFRWKPPGRCTVPS